MIVLTGGLTHDNHLIPGAIMAVNRFWEALQAQIPSPFVACPLTQLTAAQHQFIQEVYRVAREQTEAQLRPPVRQAVFSLN